MIKFIHTHDSSSGTYLEKLRRLLFGKPYVRPGLRSKNEFSCLGYKRGTKYRPGRDVGIKIKPGDRWVTFAAVTDAWTEFNWGTPTAIKQFYKHSGLPKRPASGIVPNFVMFDEQDFENSDTRYYKEIVVDNWKWDTLVIRKAASSTPEIQEMVSWIKKSWNKDHPQHTILIEYF